MTHPLRPVVLVRPAFGVNMMGWKPPATQHKELVARCFDVESPWLCQEGMYYFLKKTTKQVMCQIKTQQLLLAVPAVAVIANHLQTDIYTMFPKQKEYNVCRQRKKARHHRELLWIEATIIKLNVTYHRSRKKTCCLMG